MPTPTKVPLSKVKKVAVKTQAKTYSVVRLSMVIMVATAMLCTSFILAALLIRVIPLQDGGTSIVANAKVTRSADGYVSGEVLVKFAAKSTQLERTQAVQKALQTPVNVSTLRTVKQRVGLRTVTKTVESMKKQLVTYQSLTPVFETKVKLTNLGFERRLKRGTAADVQATADTLGRWYVLRVSAPTADLGQIIAALGKQAIVEKAELNRFVQAAASSPVSKSTAGTALKLSDAQSAAYAAAGDCNLDKVVDGKDLTILVNYLFNKGPAPKSLAAADVNRDGDINIADVTALVSTLYAQLTTGYADLTGDGKYSADDVNFLSAYLFSQGPAPSPLSAADYSKDGVVNIVDLTMAVNVLYGAAAQGTLQYGRGDANGDGVMDKRDLDFLVAYLFSQGPAPSPIGLADMDLDGSIDITDVTILVSILNGENGPVQAAATTSLTSAGSTVIVDADGGTVQPVTKPTYLLGDSNADAFVNTSDLNHLIAYLFSQGPAPSPLSRADVDLSGSVNIVDVTVLGRMIIAAQEARLALADLNADGSVTAADITVLVNYLFKQGSVPDLAKADVSGDGSVNIADVTLLAEYIYRAQPMPVCPDIRVSGTTTFLNGDVDGNGSVTNADLTKLGTIVYAKGAAAVPADRGDVNCDSSTSPLDVLTLHDKLTGGVQVVALPGDANHDGAVDAKDVTAIVLDPTDVNGDGAKDIRDTYDLVRLLKLNTVTKALPDLNGDGKVNWADADVVVNGAFQKTAVTLTADLNGDGSVDAADAYAFVTTLEAQQATTTVLAGDANADSLVDCRDVKFLHASYFQKGPKATPAARADVNGDGTANVADALLLAKRSCPGIGGGDLAGDIQVALVDSGISATQPDLKNIFASSKESAVNKKDDDGNGYVDDVLGLNVINTAPVSVDCNGHGTALARMLASKTGVASNSQLIPIKALDCKGRGFATGIARALVYATVRGADIAELPFSGYGSSALLGDVVKYAKASGMFVVGAAGNDGVSMARMFPANVSGVFTVGATTSSGKTLASYTNTGTVVNAPGASNGVVFEGTSVSATYVAGTAALALAKNPALTLTELTAKLTPKLVTPGAKNPKLLDAAKATAQ